MLLGYTTGACIPLHTTTLSGVRSFIELSKIVRLESTEMALMILDLRCTPCLKYTLHLPLVVIYLSV